MALDRYDLTKNNDEWRLEKAGSSRAVVKARTKSDAIKKMRRYMRNKAGLVRIHALNGRVQEEHTYSRKD